MMQHKNLMIGLAVIAALAVGYILYNRMHKQDVAIQRLSNERCSSSCQTTIGCLC